MENPQAEIGGFVGQLGLQETQLDQIEKRNLRFSVVNSRNLVFPVANLQAAIGGFGGQIGLQETQI